MVFAGLGVGDSFDVSSPNIDISWDSLMDSNSLSRLATSVSGRDCSACGAWKVVISSVGLGFGVYIRISFRFKIIFGGAVGIALSTSCILAITTLPLFGSTLSNFFLVLESCEPECGGLIVELEVLECEDACIWKRRLDIFRLSV